MILLVDTHLLLWAAYQPDRLSASAASHLEESTNVLVFSAASIWEVAIKASLGRAEFTADPRLLRRGLIQNGYTELDISSAHAIEAAALPAVHGDPFDRMLIGQARAEGFALLTSDAKLSGYGSPVVVV